MNREIGKSILLAILVGLSLFLTWSIWTYQGNFESTSIDKGANIKPIDPENDFSFNNVVRPYLLVQKKHQGKKETLLGTDNPDIVDSIYNEICNVKWTTSLGGPSSTGDNVFELVFPAPLKIDTINTLFDFTQSKSYLRQDGLIDRISIYEQKTASGVTTVLAFTSGDESPRFYATSTEDVLKRVGVGMGKSSLDKYFHPYHLEQIKSKQVYIPVDSLQYNKLTYSFSYVDIKDFKPIFFTELRKTYFDNNAYSDGDSLLKQDDNGNVMKYINPTTGTNSVLRDPIYQGYSFINSHKGWTDTFIYDSADSSPSENQDHVDFRLTILKNGHVMPVYSISGLPEEALISITWDNGIIYKLDRTLINVGKLYSNDPYNIYSRDKVLTILKNSRIDVKGIQDLRIGYKMDINSSQRLVNFTPDWFFKLGDHWRSISELENISTPSTGIDGGDQG